MTNHYYNSNLETKSQLKKFTFTLLEQNLTFYSDHGVFSKDTIDYGTRTLLKNYVYQERHLRILDLGCGYGPVGICLAKKFSNLNVDMVDVNLRAIELTKRNIVENNVLNAKVYESNIYDGIFCKYDCILTNPPIRAGKQVVHEILAKSYEYLNAKGEIYVVIQKKQGAPSAMAKLEETFGNCEILEKDRGYYILKSKKDN
jgi:16S rRNA (guanine1207-N2)-methyltransferase